MPSPPASITVLLAASREGDEQAWARLMALAYDELLHLARRLRRGRSSETLNTVALVHEAYLKLLPARALDWNDRHHFFGVAARAMRQVLVNEARYRQAEKRGGDYVRVTLDASAQAGPLRPEKMLALDEAVSRLERLDARQARVVECRFFAGLSIDETAQSLGVSTATVERDWRAARAFLLAEMGP